MKSAFALSMFAAALVAPAFSQPLTRTAFAPGLEDPMALAIAPDGDIYFTQLRGKLQRLRPSTGGVFEVGQLAVEHLKITDRDSPYAREDGLQGLALDPAFAKNGRIYLYYSAADKMLNRLSRFVIKDGKLDMSSEKMLLEVPTQRENKVCHHGGGVEFGPDGLLYLSLGDNTNPFESDGSNPVDEREGHEYANSQRSAGNSNDLRGKILRIKPTDDGYEIPAGNLFPPGTPKTRPEIYTMGLRNPFRFSIDPKTNVLYWGEVGPDAAKDTERGPMGYDEVNQAKKAGFYGWPFIIANNQPYTRYDFETKKLGEKFDPAAPKNTSRLNTGITDLPPAVPAFIWYPYGESKEFPVMEKGGRNAMAGPVFYYDSSRKYNMLAKEDDHTLLTYEWMRGKIYKAKLGAEEKLESLTVLADGFVHPMDLEMDKDGSLWLLEYGSDWWFNKNGRILHLTPESSNKAPVIEIEKTADRSFKVKSASDPDGDKVTVTWWITLGSDEKNLGTGSEATISEADAAALDIRAVATDGKGGSTIARISLVKEEVLPQLALDFGKRPESLSFGQSLPFKVKGNVKPNAKDITIRARYIAPTGHDSGGVQFSEDVQKIVTAKLCLACHQVQAPSVGPNYLSVSLKYRDQADAAEYLKNKIKTGGAGAWGEVPMPPQIAVTDEEFAKIIPAILHLGDGISEVKALEGTLKLSQKPEAAAAGGAWEITAEALGFSPFKMRVPEK